MKTFNEFVNENYEHKITHIEKFGHEIQLSTTTNGYPPDHKGTLNLKQIRSWVKLDNGPWEYILKKSLTLEFIEEMIKKCENKEELINYVHKLYY